MQSDWVSTTLFAARTFLPVRSSIEGIETVCHHFSLTSVDCPRSGTYAAAAPINYSILTKIKLFREYLSLSDSIKIKFVSRTSNVHIGTAAIPITNELLNMFGDQNAGGRFRSKCVRGHIRSAQSKSIGEVEVQFEVALHDRAQHHSPSRLCGNGDLAIRIEDGAPRCRDAENDINKDNLKIVAPRDCSPRKEPRSDAGPASQRSSGTANSASLLDYLSGRPLSSKEEKSALNDIRAVSPTESLMDEIESNVRSILSSPKKIIARTERPAPRHAPAEPQSAADSVRVHVFDLIVTRDGLQQICSRSGCDCAKHGTFMAEFGFGGQENPIRVFSKHFDDHLNRVDFYCSERQSVRISPHNNENVFIIVSYCDPKMAKYETIGAANISIGAIFETEDLTILKRCAIIATNGAMFGTLLLKFELGRRDARPSAEIPRTDCHRNVCSLSSCKRVESIRPAHECGCCVQKARGLSANVDDVNPSAYVYGLHENSSNQIQLKCGADSANSNYYSELRPMQSSSSNLPSTNSGDAASLQVSNDEDKDAGLVNKLSGLFYVGIINFDRHRTRAGAAFLVCRSFWSAPILADNFPNNVLNFLEVMAFAVLCVEVPFCNPKVALLCSCSMLNVIIVSSIGRKTVSWTSRCGSTLPTRTPRTVSSGSPNCRCITSTSPSMT